MKVSFKINGRQITFVDARDVVVDKTDSCDYSILEESWFNVEPEKIDRTLFNSKREDLKQEETRQIILKAFSECDNNPEKYKKSFKTLMPKKEWPGKTVQELKNLAQERGDHIANWIEQALEWAQRIQNGTPWENLCNYSDTGNWYRLVVWDNEKAVHIGGAINYDVHHAPASIGSNFYKDDKILRNTVPLVIDY